MWGLELVQMDLNPKRGYTTELTENVYFLNDAKLCEGNFNTQYEMFVMGEILKIFVPFLDVSSETGFKQP